MIPTRKLPSTFRRAIHRGDLLLYLVVPAALLGLFAEGSGIGWKGMALGYASLFVTTLSIGSAHTLYFLGTCPLTDGRTERWWWVVPYYGLGVVVGTRLGVEVSAWIHSLIWDVDPAASRDSLLPTAYVVSALVVTAMVTLSTLQARRRASEEREQAARQEALRAQLAALQARTDPHFLFNSLNTVASLIEHEPAKAEEAVHRLSAMFRYTLEGSRRELVPLGEEIAMVRNYLETESLRFGERLQHEVVVEPAVEPWLLPPLTLQPLVENAVHHGIDQVRRDGRVTVRAEAEGDTLRLTVEDNGPGHDPRANGAGTGLADLTSRLQLRYGDDASLDHGPAEPGYRAVVRIPATP